LLTGGVIVVAGMLFWIFAPEFHQPQLAPTAVPAAESEAR